MIASEHSTDGASSLSGRVAVVTGAGGDIGAATALRLAASGASVAAVDRKLELVQGVAAECESLSGAPALALEMDQTDLEAVQRGVGEVVERLGPVRVLFANAGYGQFAPFLETSARNWQRHVDVNLTGTFQVVQTIAQKMAEQRSGGSIVINASSGAHVYCDQLFSYCVTKAGLRMMAMGMAAELGTHRIRVNCVMPGVVETGMTAPMLEDPHHRDVLESETPVGRLGRSEDVADLVEFLASDRSGFINGAAIPIDGGQTIHGHPRWFRLDYRNEHSDDWSVPT
jgi:NAD(P)-dependent dehydrogenase (short-subunit alcohol dehydrogenase family)